MVFQCRMRAETRTEAALLFKHLGDAILLVPPEENLIGKEFDVRTGECSRGRLVVMADRRDMVTHGR